MPKSSKISLSNQQVLIVLESLHLAKSKFLIADMPKYPKFDEIDEIISYFENYDQMLDQNTFPPFNPLDHEQSK